MEIQLLAFMVVILVLTLAARRAGVRTAEPVAAFLGVWWVICIVTASGIVEYRRVLTWLSFIVASVGCSAFVVGSLMARARGAVTLNWRTENDRTSGMVGGILLLSAAFAGFVLLGLLPMFLAGELSPSRWEDLRRELFTKNLLRISSPISLVFEMSSGLLLIGAIATPLFASGERYRWVTAAGLLAWTALALQAAQSAGRYLFVATIAMTCYAWSTTRFVPGTRPSLLAAWRTIPKLKRIAGIAFSLVAVLFLLLVFPAIRDPTVVENEALALVSTGDRQFGPLVTYAERELGWASAPTLAFSLSYFTDPLSMLTVSLEDYHIQDWRMQGDYSFPLRADVSASLVHRQSAFWTARLQLAELAAGHNYQPNPWATGLRDLTIDFGLVGMPIVAFLLGNLAARAQHASISRPTMVNRLLISVVWVSAALLPLHSPFVLRNILYATLLLSLLALATNLLVLIPTSKAANTRPRENLPSPLKGDDAETT